MLQPFLICLVFNGISTFVGYLMLNSVAQLAEAVKYALGICRGVRPHSYECPGLDTKQPDGEAPVMLEFWGMRNIPLLPPLPGPLWPGVLVLDRVLSMRQIELFNHLRYLKAFPCMQTND